MNSEGLGICKEAARTCLKLLLTLNSFGRNGDSHERILY
jgi:hypothetical protein